MVYCVLHSTTFTASYPSEKAIPPKGKANKIGCVRVVIGDLARSVTLTGIQASIQMRSVLE